MDIDALRVPTLHEVVTQHAARNPNGNAIRFEGAVLSYAALDRLANRLANTLRREGLGLNDRLVFIGRNSDALPVIALAANKIGAVPVPLNWRLAKAEVVALIKDAEARIIFVEPEFEEMVADLVAPAQGSMRIVSARSLFAADNKLDHHDTLADPVTDPLGIAVQIYTSGTTGMPKGVMLTHRGLLGINALRADHLPWDTWSENDVTLVSAPIGHVGAYGMLVRALFFGGAAIIQEIFDADQVLDAIERHGVSKIALVPTAIKILVEHPRADKVDYRRIDTIIYGASPITQSLLRQAIDVFQCRFAQSYGMSETSGPVVALSPEDHEPPENPRLISAGRALPGTIVRILDASGNEVALGDVGEICVRSIANMAGYWKNAEATAAAFAENGFLRTGDAGYMDADGYVYVSSRVKDMIISGAENIYPIEVENAIASHPDVGEVAVIGVPDDYWGRR
ncbi:AMP-binding protein [Sphingomonas aliaeris]|uniref:AMP-binding protein n=1 Tax=Sphingomonas aliaeris TaxID=2759526 RepID=A0A974NXM7_9SPHN|nr:AMP-binding protein [Sphingomonas aliaeris]QQV78785.1 AMP-binding protein [Sphingomonas aliaeris]